MVADERICIWGTERYILSEKEMENGRSQDNNVIRGMVKDIHFKLPRKNYKYPKMLGKFVPPQYNNVEKSWEFKVYILNHSSYYIILLASPIFHLFL